MHYVSKSLFKTLLPLLSTIAVLVACGGGGGGGDAAPAPSASTPVAVTPTPTPTPVTPTPRPLDQPDFELRPNTGTVKVGESLVLDLVDCSVVIAGARKCRKNGEDLVLVEGVASNWAVNGIVGGNSTVGTIVGTNVGATYKAPASKPAPASVSVSAKVAGDITFPLLIVVANLTIVDTAAYRGTVSYTVDLPGYKADVVAEVAWTLVYEDSVVRNYIPSGTMRGTVQVPNCDLVTASVPINESRLLPNGNWSEVPLVVFTSQSPTPNRYFFYLDNDQNSTANFTCVDKDGKRTTGNLPPQFSHTNISCGNPSNLPSYSTADVLEGSASCPLYGLTSSWRFVKQ